MNFLWGWEFLPPPQPPQVFTARDFEVLFPCSGTLGCTVCLAPPLFLPAYPHTNVEPPGLPATILVLVHVLPTPGCLSPPILPGWMNVSSLTPWLLDFHTVRFSGSSGWFLFLNWLLSFFCLCEEAKCVYLSLHLHCKSDLNIFNIWVYWLFFVFFLRFCLFFREGKGEREGEKYQCVVTSHMLPTRNLAYKPGMCPEWESNWWPFDSQAGTEPLSHTSHGCLVFSKA